MKTCLLSAVCARLLPFISRLRLIWGLMFMSWMATVNAATLVYTDKTAWENALGGEILTEDFADAQLNTGVSFVSTESGHINPAQQNYQDVLASVSQNEPTTTWSFTPEITAYGGNWTLGGPGGSGNSLQVYIADSSLFVGSIPSSYGGGFWGFISNSPFTSVKLIGGTGTNQQHYALDNMVYSAVPVPASVWLFCSGILGLIGLARRKTA